jgi:hypothetical protein
MITLNRDTLSFTFPELARQVRLRVERQIQAVAEAMARIRIHARKIKLDKFSRCL